MIGAGPLFIIYTHSLTHAHINTKPLDLIMSTSISQSGLIDIIRVSPGLISELVNGAMEPVMFIPDSWI